MKKYIAILISTFFLNSCDADSTKDCLRGSGKTETRVLDISGLEQLTIRENISLKITFSTEESLEITGGKYHLDQLEIVQNGNEFEFKVDGLCSTGFSEAPIVIKLKSSRLKYVRNSSQFDVISTNTLEFEELTLVSEDFNDTEALSLGNFKIEVDNSLVNIVGSGISDFELSGKTKRLNFGTFSGSGTVLARQLEAEVVTFFHRSFRNAVVTPIQRLEGEIRSSGNLISTKKPPQVDVEAFYTGELIFE
jgi:hypothetical protein